MKNAAMMSVLIALTSMGWIWYQQHTRISIPELDLSIRKADPVRFESSLMRALEEYGVMYLNGHGISQPLMKKYLTSNKRVLSVQPGVKQELESNKSGVTRGYIAVAGESGSNLTEWKESFSYGFDWNQGKDFPENPLPLEALNLWPEGMTQEREDLESIFTKVCEIAFELCFSTSHALGMDQVAAKALCSGGERISFMRLFHYLPQDSNKNYTGSSPHTDWGFLTLILPDSEGLEVFHRGRWHRVPHKEGKLLVNVGDYLSMMSRARVLSPLHRVVLSDSDRYSFVFFFYPNYKADFRSLLDKSPLQDRFSLLRNQQADSSPSQSLMEFESFGDFVLHKWKQVQRKQ
jgi:isopenicillin N synthase-like dioxygenase